jgi:hypothetical protein
VSSKEAAIAIIERLPDSATIPEIIKAIAHNPSLSEPMDSTYSLDELTEDEWAAFVARGLGDELTDELQDHYETDKGASANGAR